MSNENLIYKVSIKDVVFKISRNYTPYVSIIMETLDDNKLQICSNYYFTTKAKFLSYNQLIDIINMFNIEVDRDNILNSLLLLKGKEVYLKPIFEYKNKYQILKDYKESQDI